jgi:hypothetical protein
MDQTGPEFFMKSYCGSGNGWSQGPHNFLLCQTGLGRRGRAAGSGLPRGQQGSRSRRSFLWVRDVLSEKIVQFYFQGRIVRP